MIKTLRYFLLLTAALTLTTSAFADTAKITVNKDGWTYLFDKDMTQWTTYLGIPRAETRVTGIPKDDKGNYTQAVGFNKDERGVFTTKIVDGEPVLHVSGEIYGSVHTKQEFENYHLVVQFKWGEQKWPPRLPEPLDTGILYHVIGDHGVDYWKAWALSQEFQ